MFNFCKAYRDMNISSSANALHCALEGHCHILHISDCVAIFFNPIYKQARLVHGKPCWISRMQIAWSIKKDLILAANLINLCCLYSTAVQQPGCGAQQCSSSEWQAAPKGLYACMHACISLIHSVSSSSWLCIHSLTESSFFCQLLVI
jgi:hypothetical protein